MARYLSFAYGFLWGPAEVTRIAEVRDMVAIRVTGKDGDGAEGDQVQVYVSPKGKSIRVFRNGVELKG